MTLRGASLWAAGCLLASFLFFAFALPPLLQSRSYGSPFQQIVLSFLPLLERLYEPYTLEDGASIRGLIVLGGHTSRANAAKKLLMSHPDARVLATGPGDRELQILETLPVPPGNLTIISGQFDTFGEATAIGGQLDIRPGDTWLLVTSAIHMPRALATFRAQCLRVYPWPVRDSLPSPHHAAPVIYREMMALLVYVLQGRIGPIARRSAPCTS